MKKWKIWFIVALSALLVALTVFSALVVNAWFSNLPRVYTSDQDNGQIARIGMRINLLFERLRPGADKFPEGSTITYGEGFEATFDSTAEWGTKENPYIISLPRHMINLYALQRAGYFYDRYISKNYDDNGDYIEDSVKMPYFLICDEQNGSPKAVDGNGLQIQPIGNDQYPFIGCIGGAQASGTASIDGKTSISSAIADFEVVAKEGDVDVGLFGKIGYLGIESGSEGDTFNGAISVLNDLLLYDVRIVSKNTTIVEQIADHLFANDITNHTIQFEEDHHIGILAGHIEYAKISNISVYYSSDSIRAIDVNDSGANYLSDTGFIGLVYNLNPEVSGNAIGSSSGSTIAGAVKGAGNEWGASIDMKTLWDLLNNFQTRNTNTNYASQYYAASKTIIVDEATLVDGKPKVTENQTQGNLTDRQGTRYTYSHIDFGSVTVSDSINDLITPIADNSDLDTCNVVKVTYHTGTEDAFYLSQNGTYLNINAAGNAVTTAMNDGENTKWRVTADGKIRTEILGEWYYLNRNGTSGLSIGTSDSSATVWSFTQGAGDTFESLLSTNYNSTNYYLSYNAGWGLTRVGNYYYITDQNGHYLSGTTSDVTNVADQASSVKWVISSPTGSTTAIATEIGGTLYYLTGSSGNLATGTTSFTWNNDNGVYYTTIQGIRHYLVYDNGWRMVPASGKKIGDGNGHYLTATTGTVGNASESAAVVWQFSSESGNTQIYTILNGQKYYLTVSAGVLSVSTTAATWDRSGNAFSLASNGRDYYLTYEDGWSVKSLEYFTIDDGGSNYLRVTGANAFANGNADNATHFYFANENGANSSGRVYCIVGGNTYYLYNNNGTLNTTTTQNTGTQWQNDGSSLCITTTDNDFTTTYALTYDSTWQIKTIHEGKVITDGNGNYLRVTGTGATSFTNTTNIDEASVFTFSNNNSSSGYISTHYNDTTLYLRNYDGALQLSTNTRTDWTNDGTRFVSTYTSGWLNQTTHTCYLGYYGNEWRLSDGSTQITTSYYTISRDGHYLCVNSSGTIYDSTSASDAALWVGNSGTIYTVVNGTTYYLHRVSNSAFNVSTTETTSWTNNGNRLHYSNRYLSYRSGQGTDGWYINSRYSTTYAATISLASSETVTVTSHAETLDTTRPTVTVNPETDPAPEVSVSAYTAPNTNIAFDGPYENDITFEKTTARLFTREEYTEPVGETYIPLAWDVNEESNDPPFTVSQKNTGYIMSGTVDNRTGNSYGYGDIRVSGYAKGQNIGNSLTNNQLADSKIRTYVGGTLQTVENYDPVNFVKYAESKAKFQDTLDLDNTNVYGLHFMDAPISKDNTVTIPKAVINEVTYENYKMPKDCIDFRLRTRGYINFFAGTYYTQSGGNNTFFSLHHIHRGDDWEIVSIQEIRQIYGVPGNDKKPYIYHYADGAYSSGSSSPVGTDGYQLVFDMEWVTNPSIDWSERYLYYYEIPVNSGEYALGSVSGKNGAYLCYLDIGTSAADHTSVLGTIDYVYDNTALTNQAGGNKIVVVPDTSESDDSFNYYHPSLAVMYTKNTDDNNSVDIDVFTVNVRRTVANNEAVATLTTTFGEADSSHLEVVLQYSGGDNLATTYASP